LVVTGLVVAISATAFALRLISASAIVERSQEENKDSKSHEPQDIKS
jgi:multisubunit Na+/H+ antiporter MnhC subunit